jgi:hypothetical protein
MRSDRFKKIFFKIYVLVFSLAFLEASLTPMGRSNTAV